MEATAPAPHHELPEPFGEVDDACWKLVMELYDRLDGVDEIVTNRQPERVEPNLYTASSGGWLVEFECDMQHSYGMGVTPQRLADYVASQQHDALTYWLQNSEMVDADISADFSLIADPPNRRSLYEYAADKLGRSREQVDADIQHQVWAYLGELPDNLKEDFYETETEWLRESYTYGLEVHYLKADSSGNPHDEAIVEITATFRSGNDMRHVDTIGRLRAIPSAMHGIADMIATWAVARFWEQ